MNLDELAPEEESRELITELESALENALLLIRQFQERPAEKGEPCRRRSMASPSPPSRH